MQFLWAIFNFNFLIHVDLHDSRYLCIFYVVQVSFSLVLSLLATGEAKNQWSILTLIIVTETHVYCMDILSAEMNGFNLLSDSCSARLGLSSLAW